MPFKFFLAVFVAALVTWPRAAHAQVHAGQVRPDMATSAPILTYINACRGQFGVHYGHNEACFYEKPNYQGRCVCVGPRPTRSVQGAFRLETSQVGSIRVSPHLAVNIVLDEYKHEIKSFAHSCPRPEPVNYIVVSRKDSVCAFKESNYLGRKYCLNAARHMNHRFYQIPFEYQSLMVLPNKGARVKAEIRRHQYVDRSAALPSEMESGGAPKANSFTFIRMDGPVREPYTKMRIAWKR